MDILFAKGSSKKTVLLSSNTIKDIALNELIDHMGGDAEERDIIKKLMSQIPTDPNDMIFRQNIIKDLIANKELCASMSDILTRIKTLKLFSGVRKAANERDNSLYTLVQTLRELMVYVDVIEDLYSEAGLTPAAEDDPLWADAEFELPAIAQLLAYKATFADTFNENDPSADDFWTVTAMGVVAIPPENATDPFKIVHAKEALVLDYSAALLPSYEPGDAAPKLEDVYGISGNPRSDIIDIDSLSINVESSIVLLHAGAHRGQGRAHHPDRLGRARRALGRRRGTRAAFKSGAILQRELRGIS